MSSITRFATPSSAGLLLALMLAAGGTPSVSSASVSSIGRDAARLTVDSYHSVAQVCDQAWRWGRIAWWWINPEAVSS